MWVRTAFFCIAFTIPPLLQVKNQHLTVLNKRRRLEWCSSMLQRLSETKRLWDLFSQDTHFSQIQLSLFSLFHPALLCGFLWFLAVSLPAFFSLSWLFGVVRPREICTMFLLLLSCSRLITHGDGALASRRQLPQKCSSATSSGRTSPFSSCASSPTTRTRGSVRVKPCLVIVSAHAFLAIFGAWLQLHVESGFRCFVEHSSACGNMVNVSPVPLSFSVSRLQDLDVAKHFKDPCA